MRRDPRGHAASHRRRRLAKLLPLLDAQGWICNGCGKQLDDIITTGDGNGED